MTSTGLTVEISRYEALKALYAYILENKANLSDKEAALVLLQGLLTQYEVARR